MNSGKIENLTYHIFGCYCYIFNDKENLGKFNLKLDKEIFLGYASKRLENF